MIYEFTNEFGWQLRMTAMVVLIGILPGWASHEEQTGKSELIVLVDCR